MLASWIVVAAALTVSQQGGLANGGFEEADAAGRPKGWNFPEMIAKAGYRASLSDREPKSGRSCGSLTAPEKRPAGSFGNLMQSLDATPWRGKRVRFRAFVQTKNLTPDGRAQLWLRVDRKSAGGVPAMGAFDNMDNRPIRSDEWKTYEIVAAVDQDAERIHVGLLLMGAGEARIDDAAFEAVDAGATVTAVGGGAGGGKEIEDPVQPFFTPWLLMAAAVVGLLAAANLPASLFQRFAFRFSFAYWLLYFLPAPFQGFGLSSVFAPYARASDAAVRWTAVNVLGVTRTLIPPNGSGDTTYDYIRLFAISAISAAVAILWLLIDRRNRPALADLLRSYLRYTLGITLLGYGLAKMTETTNQFPMPEIDQLAKTYGDSSPMNLLWTFMGTSLPYTRFTGLCEMAPAFLLAWRRTALAGALASAAVMLNIFALNLAYDVPVKQYSFHLFFASVWLALPATKRLLALLLGRAADAEDIGPPYVRGGWKWLHRAAVAALFLFAFALPAYETFQAVGKPADASPPYIGAFSVESLKRGGKEVDAGPARWRRVSFVRTRFAAPGEKSPREFMVVTVGEKPQPIFSRLKESAADGKVLLENPPPGGPATLAWKADEDGLVLVGDGFEAKLKRIRREDYLLVRRGFRWINERPFNR